MTRCAPYWAHGNPALDRNSQRESKQRQRVPAPERHWGGTGTGTYCKPHIRPRVDVGLLFSVVTSGGKTHPHSPGRKRHAPPLTRFPARKPSTPYHKYAHVGHSAMPQIPRDPEHDIDTELRHMLARETRRYLVDVAPAWNADDDPEV